MTDKYPEASAALRTWLRKNQAAVLREIGIGDPLGDRPAYGLMQLRPSPESLPVRGGQFGYVRGQIPVVLDDDAGEAFHVYVDAAGNRYEHGQVTAMTEPCLCDRNPETTDGPEEHCPAHGRPYSWWVQQVARHEDRTYASTRERAVWQHEQGEHNPAELATAWCPMCAVDRARQTLDNMDDGTRLEMLISALREIVDIADPELEAEEF